MTLKLPMLSRGLRRTSSELPCMNAVSHHVKHLLSYLPLFIILLSQHPSGRWKPRPQVMQMVDNLTPRQAPSVIPPPFHHPPQPASKWKVEATTPSHANGGQFDTTSSTFCHTSPFSSSSSASIQVE